MGFIYKIINDINDKIYVGMTRYTIENRWKEHKINYRYKNTHLYSAMKKYGIEHFKILLIEECPIDKLIEREAYWIKKLDSFHNGYNMTEGKGEGNATSFNARKVEQYDLEGNYITTYSSLSEAGMITHTESRNIRRAAVHQCKTAGGFQWKFPDDPIKIEAVELPHGGGKGKPTYQIDLKTGEILNEFSSASQAAIFIGVDKCKIINCCNHKKESCEGYKWEYKENY